MLRVVLVSVIMPSEVVIIVIMLSVVSPSVIMLIVVAPYGQILFQKLG